MGSDLIQEVLRRAGDLEKYGEKCPKCGELCETGMDWCWFCTEDVSAIPLTEEEKKKWNDWRKKCIRKRKEDDKNAKSV